MKKVLIIAYEFPPYNSIASQRPWCWYKYFGKLGIEPTVLTRHWDYDFKNADAYLKPSNTQEVSIEKSEYGQIIRVPVKKQISNFFTTVKLNKLTLIARKAVTFLSTLLRFNAPILDISYNIFEEGKKYMKENDFDCIVATGEPFILFKYASKLSKQFQVPWVADYRDGWSTNELIGGYPLFQKLLHQHLYSRFERKYLSNAALITTASPAYQKPLSAFHSGKSVITILNGFESELFDEVDRSHQKGSFFKISYAGFLYPYQPIELFLEGLLRFLKKHGEAKVKMFFYGMEFYPDQVGRIKSFSDTLENIIEFTPRLPRQELYPKLVQSHLLLLPGNPEVDALPGKVFDYLALHRQILMVIKNGGVLEEILTKTQSGIFCENIDDAVKNLEECYTLWERGESFEKQPLGLEGYTRFAQAKKMIEIMSSIGISHKE